MLIAKDAPHHPLVESAANDVKYDLRNETDIREVNRRLRNRAGEPAGLGVTILAAWAHGVGVEHIPQVIDGKKLAVKSTPRETDRDYEFVRVELRDYRNDKLKLRELGIQDGNPDPLRLAYHEDGLVSILSFPDHRSHDLSDSDTRETLRALNQQGILVKAHINNRQIQFKDFSVRQLIEASGEEVYVVDHNALERAEFRLPAGLHRKDIYDYVVNVLRSKKECNYCSVHALNPKEVTIDSAHVKNLATVRNYRFGFTFAPFGDPLEVCHFLAWDTPHISDVVMNMDPQAYSFSDLIRLVRQINHDLEEFKRKQLLEGPLEPISGMCNHWAGNSLYHQHYQFFQISHLPALSEEELRRKTLVAEYQGVSVHRLADWKAPLYIIESSSLSPASEDDVMLVADRVAREWDLLSEGFDDSYGNGISIQFHSQNIFATIGSDSQLRAVFIPRHRRKRNAESASGLRKLNAGTLEMLGYFIIDSEKDFDTIQVGMSSDERRQLGDAWLSQLSPDSEIIHQFESELSTALTPSVARYQPRIDAMVNGMGDHLGRSICDLASVIQRDGQLGDSGRAHLYRELLSLLQTPGLRLSREPE